MDGRAADTAAMKSILDRSFRYVPSHATDLRKTFERIRGERGAAAQQPKAPAVVHFDREKKPGGLEGVDQPARAHHAGRHRRNMSSATRTAAAATGASATLRTLRSSHPP